MVNKLIISFLLCYFFNLAPSYAYQFYYFKPEGITLSKPSFNQIVLPQLRVITQEYYSLLKRSFPLQPEILTIREQILSMQSSWQANRRRCLESPPNSTCREMIKILARQAKSLEVIVANFQRNKLNSKDVAHDKAVVDRILSISEFIDRITLTNYTLLSKLDDQRKERWTVEQIKNDSLDSKPIANLISSLNFYSQTLMIDMIEKDYRVLYESVWDNYIRPIEQHILPEANQEYLINNLDKLNLGWSSFHHKMERGNLSVDPSILNTISTMRNRWNEVVRQYIRNNDFMPSNKVKPTTLR